LWEIFTRIAFRSTFVTKIFDKFITKYMANMSMCRNSSVMPFQTKKANISYFCTGGVAWGKNDSRHMTSGFPTIHISDSMKSLIIRGNVRVIPAWTAWKRKEKNSSNVRNGRRAVHSDNGKEVIDTACFFIP